MRKVKTIIDHIKEEMADAKKYISCMAKEKGVDEEAFRTYSQLAQAEYDHAMLLHELAVKEIEKARADLKAKGIEVPAYMMEMWEEEHQEYVEKMAKIKYEIELAKR